MSNPKAIVLAYVQAHNPLYQQVVKAFEPQMHYQDVHHILCELESEKAIQCERTKEGYRYSIVEVSSETQFW